VNAANHEASRLKPVYDVADVMALHRIRFDEQQG